MTSALPPLVFGTAGHVDHGKTSLVKALTGLDLDSLPEEKERGITISLGFAPLLLPGGRQAGLVDVPDHERLVRTMIAGASGMDAVLLCVSATEGIMPQTREHLQILSLLGVSTGILVLTMRDLVDDELLELAAEELREQVTGTFLQDAPLVATSALTGQGIPELLAALDAVQPPLRPTDRPFRLPVDRSFARKGFGTVVTGTAWSGHIDDGAEVEILPGGKRARLRGIQIHRTARAGADAGARTALNLAGLDLADAPRGAWVCTPGAVPSPLAVDVRYHHLPDAPLLDGEPRVLVLLGTREVAARLLPLDLPGASGDSGDLIEPGASLLAQLRLAEPLPCLPGDRFILRRESPAATLGGGTVLDPWSPVTRRSRARQEVGLLARIEQGDAAARLERAGAAGLSADEIRARCGAPCGTLLGDRWIADPIVAEASAALQETLARLHRELPLAPGHNRKSLRHGILLGMSDRAFAALIDQEVAQGNLRMEGAVIRAPGFNVQLSAAQQAWCTQAVQIVSGAGMEGMEKLKELLPSPEGEELVFLLRDQGRLTAVADRLYAPEVLEEVRRRVIGWFEGHAELDPAGFKELTGLTRRTAIPLLEWLDQQGVTRRMGDVRVKK